MSHDGCIEVAWKGKAFPYLMHHPNFSQTENYGSAHKADGHGSSGHGSSGGYGSKTPAAAHGGGYGAPAAAHGGGYGSHAPAAAARDGESVFQAGTGTWNGPAPRGYRNSQQAAPAPPATIAEPEFVRLSTGAKMPIIGMGTAAIKEASSVKNALAIGYRGFDCAAFYGNEKIVGEGLAEFVASGRREELFVTSKVWNTCHRPADVRASCEQSLKDLGLQYLDLYLVHWPEAWVPGTEGIPENPETDTTVTLEQTWAAMESLVEAGLVKAIGVSNFSLAQIEGLLSSCKVRPSVHQVELHPYLAQRKLVGVLFRKGIVSVAYSPLGGQSYFLPNTLIDNEVVTKVAKETGKTNAQVLIKWNIQRGVPVIPKASSEGHLRENLDSMFNWKLSNDQKALLDTLDCGTRFITFPWKQWAPAEEGGVTKPSTLY